MDADELRERMRALPDHGRDAPIFDWDHHRWQLRQDVLSNRHLDDLLIWPTLAATMVVTDAPYLRDEYDALRDDWWTWEYAIHAPGICHERMLAWDSKISGTLVHQAYHLMRWQEASGKRIVNCDGILEIGGGYGAMALVCRQLGYKGDYTILDVPEVSLIQEYYLSRAGVGGVQFITRPEDAPSADLCISCFSTSELYLWERWLPETASYLFAYYAACDDIDNSRWFKEFADTHLGHHWSHEQASEGNRYLFGWVAE